ncbi:hypothetical protein AAHE18_18G170900 [Arachis hypogaea]|nr:uncharacterized protein DS421_18g626450 [Arachis hypogaea]
MKPACILGEVGVAPGLFQAQDGVEVSTKTPWSLCNSGYTLHVIPKPTPIPRLWTTINASKKLASILIISNPHVKKLFLNIKGFNAPLMLIPKAPNSSGKTFSFTNASRIKAQLLDHPLSFRP